MTRRDALERVLRGLEVLASFPEAHPIKVNAVAMRGFTEDEVIPFARFAREHPYEVRFIEFMPLDADHAWSPDDVLTGEEIRAAIHAVFPLEPEPRKPSSTARTYRFADGRGRIGFINPVSEPFCGDCNRIRLTADGQLRTCLFSLRETDLRARAARRRRRRRARDRSCATRCGARSSSTTSATRASYSRRARCPRSAADQSSSTVTRSPAGATPSPAGISANASAPTIEVRMCELCGPVACACQPSSRSSSRQRTACIRVASALAGLGQRRDRAHALRALDRRARAAPGRANSTNVTNEETGLPGRPNTSVAPRDAERGRLAGPQRDAGRSAICDAELGERRADVVVARRPTCRP